MGVHASILVLLHLAAVSALSTRFPPTQQQHVQPIAPSAFSKPPGQPVDLLNDKYDAAGNYIAPLQGPGGVPFTDIQGPPDNDEQPSVTSSAGEANAGDEDTPLENEKEPDSLDLDHQKDYEKYLSEKDRIKRRVLKLLDKGFHDGTSKEEAQISVALVQKQMEQYKQKLPRGADLMKKKKQLEELAAENTDKMQQDEYEDDAGRYPDQEFYDNGPYAPQYDYYEDDEGGRTFFDPNPSFQEYMHRREQEPGDMGPNFYTPNRPNYRVYQNNRDPQSYARQSYNRYGADYSEGEDRFWDNNDMPPRHSTRERYNMHFQRQHRAYDPHPAAGRPHADYDVNPPRQGPHPAAGRPHPAAGRPHADYDVPPPRQGHPARGRPHADYDVAPPRVRQGSHNGLFSPSEQMELRQREDFIHGSRNTFFNPGNYGGAI